MTAALGEQASDIREKIFNYISAAIDPRNPKPKRDVDAHASRRESKCPKDAIFAKICDDLEWEPENPVRSLKISRDARLLECAGPTLLRAVGSQRCPARAANMVAMRMITAIEMGTMFFLIKSQGPGVPDV